MDYTDLINKFWEFNKTANIKSSAKCLYLYLLNIWSQNNHSEVIISDVVLSSEIGIHRNTIRVLKNKLQELGLIRIKTKKGFPCSFEIITDYIVPIVQTEQPKAELLALEIPKIKIPIIERMEEPTSVVEKQIVAEEKIIEKTTETKPTEPPQQPPIFQPPNEKRKDIPTLEEFMNYAKTVPIYTQEFDFQIQTKYESWLSNDWKNGYGKPIRNWQTSLKACFPHFKNPPSNNIFSIPTINRPKSTYDE